MSVSNNKRKVTTAWNFNTENGYVYWLLNTSPFRKVFLGLFYIVFACAVADTIYGLIRSVQAFFSINVALLPTNILLLFGRVAIPIMVWVFATGSDWFTYKKRRRASFIIVLIHGAETLLEYIFRGLMLIITSFLLYIPVHGNVSTRIVVYAGYYLVGMTYVGLSVYFYKTILSNVFDELTQKRIDSFYLTDYFSDLSVRKKFSYPLDFIRYLDTGKQYTISMKDRYLHMLGLGSTGTGKTSSCISVAFAHDLLVKAQNLDYQKKKVEQWIKSGNVRLKRDINDDIFNLCYFEGIGPHKKKYDKKIANLAKHVPNAGFSIMCPDTAFADEVYALAKSKGFKVNRIDPFCGADGAPKEDSIGMNPLYVNPELLDINQEHYLECVIQIAELFAEVNQAIFDQAGHTDPYFAGVNRNMAVNAAVIMIIAVPLRDHRIATISDVLSVLNNFVLIKDYREAIIKRFGEDVANIPGKKEFALGRTKVGDTLQQYIDSIDVDFLGANAAEMNKQCTGLRNIIKFSVALPRIKKILNASNTIDFDEILNKSEITIINFDLALGRDISTSFGLFFMLNFINAVLRRDKNTASPHFFYIDEAHALLHPRMDVCATVFRKFKVGCMFFMQSLSQMDKSDSTKFLKNLFVGNMVHQLIFGRASLEEMRYYSEIGGTKKKIETEESTRESSLSLSDTSLQTSTSNSVVDDDRLSETDIRYRRFLECTVFSVRRSMPLPPFLGKVNFLHEKNGGYIKRYTVDWAKYLDSAAYREALPEENVKLYATPLSATYVSSSPDGTEVSGNGREPILQSTVSVSSDVVDNDDVTWPTLSSGENTNQENFREIF